MVPLLVARCAVDSEEVKRESAASTETALSGFDVRTAFVQARPPSELPSIRLGAASFDHANLQRKLMDTGESFEDAPVSALGLVRSLSPSWSIENSAARGLVIAVKRVPSGPPVAQNESALQEDSLRRLGRFGIPSSEILRVHQTASMSQDLERTGGVPTPPTVERYKTFVFRGINGVEVEGHRAVISHAPDGSFHKAFIKWPPLASTGHKLRTTLGEDEIRARAMAAVKQTGATSGLVNLRWKYVASPQPDGEVTLTLKIGASMRNTEQHGEPREIDVDVSAM